MYILKFGLMGTDESLASELKRELENTCDINIIKSTGLLGSTEIIIAIVAAAPGIITTIAGVIKNYLERNDSKSFTVKIGNEEHTYKGYSMEEIQKIEELFSKNGKNITNDSDTH